MLVSDSFFTSGMTLLIIYRVGAWIGGDSWHQQGNLVKSREGSIPRSQADMADSAHFLRVSLCLFMVLFLLTV